jgi:hypothetical protein
MKRIQTYTKVLVSGMCRDFLASKDCLVDIWITEVVYAVKKQWIRKLRFLFRHPRRQMLCLYYNLESNTRTHVVCYNNVMRY